MPTFWYHVLPSLPNAPDFFPVLKLARDHPTGLDVQKWIPDEVHVTSRVYRRKLLQYILG